MDTVEDAMEAKEELRKSEEVDAKETSLQVKVSNLFGKLTRTLGWGPSPTKVLQVQWNDYATKTLPYKEGMFAVSPIPETDDDDDRKLSYEVVIQAEINNSRHAYSLLRTSGENDAISLAKEYQEVFPCIVETCGKEFLNQSTLQKVLDVFRDRPTFNSAHVVAYFGFTEALKHENVIRMLNVPDKQRGLYPLHVAVEIESEKIIHQLLAAGAAVEVFDKQGNSPLHMAASTSVSIIQALKPRGNVCINVRNGKGETPLLIAAKVAKLDNIKCLIQFGANLNHDEQIPSLFDTQSYHDKIKVLESTRDISQKDIYKGGSLLHWVKTRELINLALDMGCEPNLRNELSQTPLHVMILRGRLLCMLTLLTRGADTNAVNNEGNSPLHLAASMSSVPMVQALICFGANINAVNRSGETPRHLAATVRGEDRSKQFDKDKVIYLLHAVGAKRCRVKLASCSEGCSVDGSYNGMPVYDKPLLRSRWVFDEHLAKTQISEAIKYQRLFKNGRKGRGRVLCLDGGGIKGLVLCQMLYVIRNLLGQSIKDSFDWISGTSTGGFLALHIASGKSVNQAQSLYYGLKDRVFVGTRPYDTNDLENILKEEFGEDTLMSSITGPKVTITTTLADRLPADLHLFRNYEAPIDILGIGESSDFVKPLPPHLQKMWLAARASGAAPTYFSSTDKYLDGGLVANNPVLDTLAEIEEWNMAVRAAGREDEVFIPTVVVSLGCGRPPVVKVDNVDLTVPSILEMRKGFQAVYNMFNLLVEQACASDGRVVDRALAWCSSLHVPFFRFNPPLSEDCALDEHDDAKLVRVMWEARAYMESQAAYLAQLKDLLVNSEDERDISPGRNNLPYPPRRRSAPSTPVKKGISRYSSTSASVLNQTLPEERRMVRSSCSLRGSQSDYALAAMSNVTASTQTSSHEEGVSSHGEEDSFHSDLNIDPSSNPVNGNEYSDGELCEPEQGQLCEHGQHYSVYPQEELHCEFETSGEFSVLQVVNLESGTDEVQFKKKILQDRRDSLTGPSLSDR